MANPHLHSRLLAPVAVAFFALLPASPAAAVQVFVDDFGDPIAWPTAGGVVTGDEANFTSNDRSTSSPWTLSQTFQVDSTFDLNSIFIPYRNKLLDDISVGLQIFPVADVNAPSLPATPASTLLDLTFDSPSTNFNTENGVRTITQIVLDSPLSLPTTSGTAGYAIRFTDFDETREWRWYRTSGSSTPGPTVGNQYNFGRAYENLDEKTGPDRDFALALSSLGAPIPPAQVFSVQSGAFSAGSTWDSGLPPAADAVYNVADTHTVAVDASSFAGDAVVVQAGGTIDFAVDGANLKQLTVEPGGSLTTSVSGTFGIGDINATPLMNLELNEGITISPSAGSDFFLDANLTGSGDIDFQASGAGTDLFLTAAGQHDGVIRFNGSGAEVRAVDFEGVASIEMNSTGANRLFLDPGTQTDGESIVFNQPGEIVHAAFAERRQGVGVLEVNAATAIDLTTNATTNELRFRLSGELRGAADLSVQGTTAAPAGVVGDGVVSANEFEVGLSTQPETLGVDPYSGTISATDHVNVEIFNSLPAARVTVGNNATLDVGHRVVDAAFSLELGGVQVDSGGTLIVGFSEASSVEVSPEVFEVVESHHAHTLTLTSGAGRDGGLTLAAGSTTVMQINGTAEGEFDSIAAQGQVSLGGELRVLINPVDSDGDADNPVYSPTLGDTFDLISIAPQTTDGDFDGDGTVDGDDYQLWTETFGSTEQLAADGNGDGVIDAADYTVWRDNQGDVGTLVGTVSGSISLDVIDPDGVLSGAGFALALNITPSLVRVEVIAAGAGTVVPEPLSASLLGLATLGGLLAHPRRS